MKLNKVEFKRFVKQCVKEVLQENTSLTNSLVKEAIIEILGERVLQERTVRTPQQQPAPQQQVRRPQTQQRKINVPAMVKRPGAAPIEEMAAPTDLFESIVADTMINTMPKQQSSDKTNPKSRSWEELVTANDAADDSPLKHLRAAAMTPSHPQRGQQRQVMEAVQQFEQDDSPSQAQLEAMYKQRQASPQPQSQPRTTTTSADDFAMLGLDNKTWDQHIDSRPSHGQFDLSSLAAEMNADLD